MPPNPNRPPAHLDAEALGLIKNLVADPLADIVRAEMEARDNKMAGLLEVLSARLLAHVRGAEQIAMEHNERLEQIESRVTQLETVRWKMAGAWVVLTAVGVASVELLKYVFRH